MWALSVPGKCSWPARRAAVHHRSEELCELVPPGANFGYDVMVYAGKALWQRHRNEAEVVAELAAKNVRISPRQVSYLAMRFVTCLAIAHQRRAADIKAGMQARGGYICHLDATCEGGGPFLMSSIDSLSEIVLGNIKLPSEDRAHIVPFLERIKKAFGVPLALVHDMGKGILAAVAEVFPGVADFICHFHFLRDIGKDLLGAEYDTIRKRLSKHGISAALRYRAKRLKAEIDANPAMIEALQEAMASGTLAPEDFESAPVVAAYTLIQWALKGKTEGDGYGFPFDRPHLSFAQRLRHLNTQIERIKDIHLRGQWRDNVPLLQDPHRLETAHQGQERSGKPSKPSKRRSPSSRSCARPCALPCRPDRTDSTTRAARATSAPSKRVCSKFRDAVVRRKDYAQDADAQKMIEQIDKYWNKLFADPIAVHDPLRPPCSSSPNAPTTSSNSSSAASSAPTGAEPATHPQAACSAPCSPKPRWSETWTIPPT